MALTVGMQSAACWHRTRTCSKVLYPTFFWPVTCPLLDNRAAVLSCIPAAVGAVQSGTARVTSGRWRDSTALQRDASAAMFPCTAAASAACSRQRAAAALARGSSSSIALQIECVCSAASQGLCSTRRTCWLWQCRLGLQP